MNSARSSCLDTKVVSRLTQLIATGEVVKDQAKIGDSKKVVYKLA